MASPFSIFRKHQKIAYAILTIACMVVFVFAGPFGRSGNGPTGGAKGVEVATWKFGTIYSTDVQNLRSSRGILNAFFAEAYRELAAKGKLSEGARPPQFPTDQKNLLDAIVFHKKAEQMGIVVNDDAANEQLESATHNALTSDEKAQVAAKVSAGLTSRLTARQLVDYLRFELELNALASLLQSDVLEISTPQQRWDYFSRLTRQATVEVLPVAVKDFVGKVKATPSDAELNSFFEKYKNNFSSPESPTPGFMEPPRANFQYFVAKEDELVKEEKPKVTDDEIKQHYEKNKDQFKKTDEDSNDTTDKTKPADTKKPDSKATPDAGKPSDKNEKSSKDEKPPAENKPADSKAPDAKSPDTKAPDAKSSDLKSSDSKSSDSKSPESKTAPDGKSSNGKAPADGKSSRLDLRSRRVVREELLALADDASPKAASAPASSDKSADSSKAAAAAPKDDASKKGAVSSAPEKTPDGKTAPAAGDQKGTPEKSAPAATGPAKSEPAKAEPAKAEPAKSESTKNPSNIDAVPGLGLKPGEAPKKIQIVEYRSLDDEKVRDEIREDIAKQKVRDQVDAAFKDLSIKVSSYKRKLDAWSVHHTGDAPPAPDYLDLARQNKLKYEETGLVTAQEAYDTLAIGKSYTYSFAGQQFAQISFTQQAFNPDLGNFKPEQTDAATPAANFLWWRVDYKEAYVPEFAKVKSHVLDVWKMVEARKLALAQAKEYADEANKQKAKLDEMFKFQPNVHVSTLSPFTWMTEPAVALDPTQRTPPHLSNVSGVDKAGEAFMKTVFRLDAGSTGVAMNQPETVAYVIQAISFAPSEQDFHRQFLSEMAITQQRGYGALGATALDSKRAELAKFDAIFKDFDFKQLPSATRTGSSAATSAPVDEGDE